MTGSTLADIVGYIRTWSGFRKYCQEHDGDAFVETFITR